MELLFSMLTTFHSGLKIVDCPTQNSSADSYYGLLLIDFAKFETGICTYSWPRCPNYGTVTIVHSLPIGSAKREPIPNWSGCSRYICQSIQKFLRTRPVLTNQPPSYQQHPSTHPPNTTINSTPTTCVAHHHPTPPPPCPQESRVEWPFSIYPGDFDPQTHAKF